MGMGAGAGQPTSGTGQVGGVGMGQQLTAQPGAKGGTGSNVPAGKGSVTGGQQATNNTYPAYNPQQNTYGALGSTNVYNPVTANNQQPQMPQSNLNLPQGGFQPNYGMYTNQLPMPGGGLIPNMGNQANINYAPQKPLNAGYAGLAPQTGATMMPYQGGMNGMPNYANSGRPMGDNAQQSGMFGGMNPQEQMMNQMRQKEFSGLTPQQQQNATQYGDAYYGQQPSAMTPAQMASSGLSQVPQYAQPAMAQQAYAQQLRGLPQNAGQMPQAPTQQRIGQPNQRQEMQRFMQQFRPNRNNR